MSHSADMESFVGRLTSHQSQLYAFIYSMVGDAELTKDIFQETNLVLWRKMAEFDASREFLPWAFAIARNQVLAARTKQKRDRLLFDEEMMNRIADRIAYRSESFDARQTALARCIEHLPPEQREVVKLRYQRDQTMDEVARAMDRTANAVAVAVHRIRRALAQCIESRLASSSESNL